jgi:hypothetical protein
LISIPENLRNLNQLALGGPFFNDEGSEMRLLTLSIREPQPGRVLPEMSAEVGPDEAARRYRAIVLTTLRQLMGLADCRLRLEVEPADAAEAVRFRLLPRLADRWERDGEVFRTEGWEIDFGGTSDGFEIHAHGDVLCPWLGVRWVHAALLGLGRTIGQVTGQARDGGTYFHAMASSPDGLELRILPELPVIRTGADWDEALESPLGAALKKAWESEA